MLFSVKCSKYELFIVIVVMLTVGESPSIGLWLLAVLLRQIKHERIFFDRIY